MTFSFSYHGGSCCGIIHIHNLGLDPDYTGFNLKDQVQVKAPNNSGLAGEYMPKFPKAWEKHRNLTKGALLKKYLDLKSVREAFVGRLLEIVINEEQYNNEWDKVLKDEMGFHRVTTFENINSGNECHIYHKYTKYTDEDI